MLEMLICWSDFKHRIATFASSILVHSHEKINYRTCSYSATRNLNLPPASSSVNRLGYVYRLGVENYIFWCLLSGIWDQVATGFLVTQRNS
jgi:hypothetical protein